MLEAAIEGISACLSSGTGSACLYITGKLFLKVNLQKSIFRALHLEEWQVHKLANCRKGTWRAAQMLRQVLTNKILEKLGYLSMLFQYSIVAENL